MSEKFKTSDEMDELSLLLDELNAGRRPKCDNPETSELLAVADLIKKAGGPVCPPQHILDQTVDRALAGIQASKPKPSRAWLFSGALGTAAAVILVVGLNLSPSWTKQIPPVVPTQPAVSQQQDTSQPKPATEPPMISQATPEERPKPVNTAPATENRVPASESQKPGPTIAQIPRPEPSKAPDTAKIMVKEMPRTSQSKSAYSMSETFPATPKSASPVITPLTIPGQVPNLVVTDKENGTLRQVYYKGTPQELTITQRLSSNTGNIQSNSQPPAMMEATDGKSDNVTIVRVTIADQEVTIEGHKTRQELLKIAESLTP